MVKGIIEDKFSLPFFPPQQKKLNDFISVYVWDLQLKDPNSLILKPNNGALQLVKYLESYTIINSVVNIY